jgi:hypothetical protein
MAAAPQKTLYYGDNRDILRRYRYIDDESVDPIDLDPPSIPARTPARSSPETRNDFCNARAHAPAA